MESSRAASGLDRISGLSEDLLVTILAALHSTAPAARTSVLSSRWRHVWTKVPDFIFLNNDSSKIQSMLPSPRTPSPQWKPLSGNVMALPSWRLS
jgi:hypothetical protein